MLIMPLPSVKAKGSENKKVIKSKLARRYPRQDGLVKSMTAVEGWNRVAIDGVNDCIAALDEIRHGGVRKTFLEMTACEGPLPKRYFPLRLPH